MKNDSLPMDGMTRSAVLMMSLGEDAAAEVFKYLSAREVQQVGAAMASLKQVTRNDVAVVLEGVALPLAGGAWITALVFSVANALLLRTRVRIENQALQSLT